MFVLILNVTYCIWFLYLFGENNMAMYLRYVFENYL